MRLIPGMIVINSKVPDWGLGKVLEDKGAVKYRVFFELAGEKTVDVRYAQLEPIQLDAPHPVLDKIDRVTSFAGFQSFESMESRFLARYREGFYDPDYLKDERDYKLAASQILDELIRSGELDNMRQAGDFKGLCQAALQVIRKTNLVFPNEQMTLTDGLKKGDNYEQMFAEAFHFHLCSDASLKVRFEKFVSSLNALDACKWTTATYYLFLADPGNAPFMKPSHVQKAADAYSFPLGYKIAPNWDTYSRTIDFYAYVADILAKQNNLKPRDMIDVQSFIWCSLRD